MCLGTLVMWISERLAIILCWVIDGVKQGEVSKAQCFMYHCKLHIIRG